MLDTTGEGLSALLNSPAMDQYINLLHDVYREILTLWGGAQAIELREK